MSRFGDNATGPSNLEISNISGVSSQINTLAGYTTELSNLGTVSAEIALLGTAAVVEDLGFLGTQATVDDMAALADVTTELGLLGTTTMTGYITDLATSTVGATTQLSIDALGQLVTEIGLLGNNLTTLQNSAANSPIQLDNLSDVDFGGNTPSAGDTIVYVAGTSKFELQPLPGAGPLSGTNFTDSSAAAGHLIEVTSLDANGDPIYNTDTTENIVRPAISGTGDISYSSASGVISFNNSSGYLTSYTETNDLTAAVVWANVPDANITASSVTQHVSNLATSANFADITEASVSGTTGDVIHWSGTAWTQGQLAYGEITGTPSVVAALNSTSNTDVLAASQGKALKDLIDGIGDITVVADNTARANLTGLDVGDIIHTTSDANHGNDWTRYQITSIAGGTTFATATSVLIAKASDFSNSNLVSIIDDGPIGTATNSAIGTITIRPNQNGTATQLQFQCENTSYPNHLVSIEGPAHTNFAAPYTIKLPQDAPAAGQVLAQNSANNQLEFVDAGATVGVAAAMAIVF